MKVEVRPRKKLAVTIVTGLSLAGLFFTGQIDADSFTKGLLGLVAAYSLGQGIADHGKERKGRTDHALDN